MTKLEWNGVSLTDIVAIDLPFSKSISNRLLILQSLSNGMVEINNLSDARDTRILNNLLLNDPSKLDVQDAGTVARFGLAWACLKNEYREIDGTARMRQRPIGPLVDALNDMGYSVSYLKKEGFLPVKISPVDTNDLLHITTIDGSTSSQFVSALCLIAPFLPNGLTIKLLGEVTSWPYIQMTLNLLSSCGVKNTIEGSTIKIFTSEFEQINMDVEPDWSAAAFWYEMVALNPKLKLRLNLLTKNSIQGDAQVADIFLKLGVTSSFTEQGVIIENNGSIETSIEGDFMETPDLAQAFICSCAGLGVDGSFTGLGTLSRKETDRIKALQIELAKIGYHLDKSDTTTLQGSIDSSSNGFEFSTYQDHRMAMSLTGLIFKFRSIELDDGSCVIKSYPQFWSQMKKLGVELK